MPQSAYIHIPFCKSKCYYCSFVSFTGCDIQCKKKYVETLIKEIKHFYKNETLKTLYFGGGTPSLLEPSLIKKIIDCFNITTGTEVTLEINPETVDSVYLKEIRNSGVNRISIGVQSFNNQILKSIGRIHTAEKAKNIVKTAQDVGFDNISVDFIYGLPKQTNNSFVNDLEQAVQLDVQHISLYGLKIEEGCKFFENYPSNIADDDAQADMYLDAIDTLTEKGFKHYEISNFAKSGFESRHNLNYWNCEEYYGFGVAAHGYVDGRRYSNFSTIGEYSTCCKEKDSEFCLTDQERQEEMIFLGLRRGIGINTQEINEKFNLDFDSKYRTILSKYIASGHLIRTDEGYKFSKEGFLLSNIILADFLS